MTVCLEQFVIIFRTFKMCKIFIVLIFGCSSLIAGAMNLGILGPNETECAYYNATEPENYTRNRTTCLAQVGKVGSCFTVWATDLATGKISISIQGCFVTDSCNRLECTDDSLPKNGMNFCYCRGNMCNREFKYVPTEVEALSSDKSSQNLIFVIMACCAAFIVLGLMTRLLIYRSKAVTFNKVSTGCFATNMNSNHLIGGTLLDDYKIHKDSMVKEFIKRED